MSDPNITEWVPVATRDTTSGAKIRGEHGDLRFDLFGWSRLGASQWEALKAKGDAILAGMRGRKAIALAAGREAELLADVSACFPLGSPTLFLSDGEWAHVAAVLDRLPGSWPL